MSRNPRILIIGAGVGGIATAVTLRRHGFDDITILEKGADVGGVWYWNRYPGLACDMPSQLYQFGFAPKADWSRMFAPGPEIQRYLADVVDQFDLRRRVRFDSEVVSADFTGTGWLVKTADGAELEADFVVAATGALHHPHIPDIPGLSSFAGTVVHTAEWDSGVRTAGRRVAVVGTGSSGIQVVSALQPEAAHITHFTRTPQWVMWGPLGKRRRPAVKKLLARYPRLNRALYRMMLNASGTFTDIVLRPGPRRKLAQGYARLSLRLQVRDPKLLAKLTPRHEPLCKRQVFSDRYYGALRARNAELVTSDIERVTPTGIRTADGREHAIDTLVLATGFRAHDYMRPMKMTGRNGLSLDDAWAKGPHTYRMTAIPGFPNLFTTLGPNTTTGSIPVQHTAQLIAEYMVRWLRRWSTGEFDTLEVTEEATTRFQDEVVEAMGPTVWNTGCTSWYLTEDGAVDLLPFDRKRMDAMLGEPEDRDFVLGSEAACAA